jgi:hypothetical protein
MPQQESIHRRIYGVKNGHQKNLLCRPYSVHRNNYTVKIFVQKNLLEEESVPRRICPQKNLQVKNLSKKESSRSRIGP